MVAEVNGDAEKNLMKHVTEGLPHGMTLPFSLPQTGGFSFGPGSGKKANTTRLPWGGARSKVAAYVRGAYLISNHHNGQRLDAFTRTVLGPIIQHNAASLSKSKSKNDSRPQLWQKAPPNMRPCHQDEPARSSGRTHNITLEAHYKVTLLITTPSSIVHHRRDIRPADGGSG